jgi:hypothetical protein
MATATGLLAVWMQIPESSEQDLNEWYTHEHLPERINCPGFQTAMRYRSISGEPKYMALYDLDTPQVLYSEAYRALQTGATEWTRRIGRSLERNIRKEYELLQSIGEAPPGPASSIVMVRVVGEPEDEVKQWLSQRALPAIAAVPGVQRARIYRTSAGDPGFLVYVELTGPDVYGSDAWKAAESKAGLEEMRPKLSEIAVNYASFIEAGKKSA